MNTSSAPLPSFKLRLLLLGAGVALLAAACSRGGEQIFTESQLQESRAVAQSEDDSNTPSQQATNPTADTSQQAQSSAPKVQPDANLSTDLTHLQQSTFVEDGESYVIRQLLPQDGIFPIYEPTFIPGSEAKYSSDELVIGIEIDGEAKAYPITLLRTREMVNDELAGTPILVTW